MTDTDMKRFLRNIAIFTAFVLSAASCHERYVTYDDAEYVMFADTLQTYAVQSTGEPVRIPVVSTVVRDYDRTFGVEVIDRTSNAIEKTHYTIESNTITIKAGENRADVLVHGHYDNIEDTDSLGVTLQLVMDKRLEMPLYGSQTKAVLMKSCPFDMEMFTGYCVLSSMFLQQYSQTGGYNRLIYTEKHPTLENTIICRGWLSDGYDVTMKFETDDPILPTVTMEKNQVASDQGSFFGTIYGEWGDKLLVGGSDLVQAIYYPCGGYLYIYTEISVEEYGVVGHFYNVMQWITDEEADRIKREGF